MTGFRLSGSGYVFRSLAFNLLSHFLYSVTWGYSNLIPAVLGTQS